MEMEKDPECSGYWKEGGGSSVSEASQYCREQRSHFMLWPILQDPDLEKQYQDNKATNHSRRPPGSVNLLSGVRSRLIAKIRPLTPLSSNVDHLQGLPVILTYASMLGAAAMMLPAPMLVLITAEPHFDEDMSKEQGLFYFLIALHTCLFEGTDTKYPPRMLCDCQIWQSMGLSE